MSQSDAPTPFSLSLSLHTDTGTQTDRYTGTDTDTDTDTYTGTDTDRRAHTKQQNTPLPCLHYIASDGFPPPVAARKTIGVHSPPDGSCRAVLVEVEGQIGGGKAVTLSFGTGDDCEEVVTSLDRAHAMAEGIKGPGRVKVRADGAVLSAEIFYRRFGFILRSMHDGGGPMLSQLCHIQEGGDAGRLVAGVVYLTRRCLIAVPQRYSACACEKTLLKHALIFELASVDDVALILYPSDVGMEVRMIKEEERQEGGVRIEGMVQRDGARFWFGARDDSGTQIATKVWSAAMRVQGRMLADDDEEDQVGWKASYLKRSAQELRADPAFRRIIYGDQSSVPMAERGVPKEHRSAIWMRLTAADKLAEIYGLDYAASMLDPPNNEEEDPLMSKALMDIDKDIARTFTEKMMIGFTEDADCAADSFQFRLKRILMAYARHNKTLGYCQSMNNLAGLLLLAVDDENDVFWLLVALVERVLPDCYYSDELTGVTTDVEVLGILLEQHLKPVHDKLRETEVPETAYAAR